MAKLGFRFYLSSGESKTIYFENNFKYVSDMDRYAKENNGSVGLSSKFSEQLGVLPRDISKITIIRDTRQREIEYSLAVINNYLNPVLDKVKTGKIKHPEKGYDMDVAYLPRNNPDYIKMRDYLFENLKGNYEHFLNNIYKNKNEFSTILFQYGVSYNQGMFNQELEERNIRNLEIKIEILLSIYGNFRSLCVARKNSEDIIEYTSNKKHEKEEPIIYKSTPIDTNITIEKETLDKMNSYVNDNGEEKEEFLDSDEIGNSKGYYK